MARSSPNEAEFEGRLESEALGIQVVTNNDLVCRDCEFRWDDVGCPVNVSKCDIFDKFPPGKPNDVLLGGPCEYHRTYEQILEGD